MDNSPMILEPNSYEGIIDNLQAGLYFVDVNRVITFWNKAAEEITGFTAAEVVGKQCSDNILTHIDCDGNNLCTGACPLAMTITDGFAHCAEIYMHHKNGHRVPVSVRVSVLADKNGKIIGGVELFTDISNQSANELRVRELEKLAMIDNLTQLANRNYIDREMQMRFEEFHRFSVSFGVLFIDIDHFKNVNDVYGHDVGDLILMLVANTFTSNARCFDLYGRWGGEEFIGIIRNVSESDLIMIGNRVRMLVEKSYIMHIDDKISVTISIGATIVTDGDVVDSIMKRADDLLYQSKTFGRNRLTSDRLVEAAEFM